jgi:hypothetical protein
MAARMAPELEPENPAVLIPSSRMAERNPAWAKNPKKPEEKTTPVRFIVLFCGIF